MKVKVKLFTTLRELAGSSEIEIKVSDDGTIRDLIEKVASSLGEEAFNYLYCRDGRMIDPSIRFLVNGIDVQNLIGFETMLHEGDVVAIIPPIGGGLS